jgi:hypothetical protein
MRLPDSYKFTYLHLCKWSNFRLPCLSVGTLPAQNDALNVGELSGLNLRPKFSVFLLLLSFLIRQFPTSNLITETSSTD